MLDAPQIANASGQSDTVTNLDIAHNRVTLKLLRGWFDGTPVLYVRTDASAVLVAALEASTYAPNLNTAPRPRLRRRQAPPAPRSSPSSTARSPDPTGRASSRPCSPAKTRSTSPSHSPALPTTRRSGTSTPSSGHQTAIKDGKQVELTSAAQVTKDFKAGLLTSAGKGPANSSLGGLRAIGFISICSTVAVG